MRFEARVAKIGAELGGLGTCVPGIYLVMGRMADGNSLRHLQASGVFLRLKPSGEAQVKQRKSDLDGGEGRHGKVGRLMVDETGHDR